MKERAEAQLAAFAAREAEVRAFVCADVAGARRVLAGSLTGPLAGVLVGVKDIIATEDFPTRCGDPALPDGAIPRRDAWVVARLRALGAVVLGKTVCTRFGIPIPGPTRNPLDLRRTPGGSSSGSAAAVAAGFVSFGIGTQTAGSVIRPASYCGVVGYKPSFGLISTEGVQPLSTTLDHVGVFGCSAREVWFVVSAMMLRAPVLVEARRPSRLLALEMPEGVCGYGDRVAALVRTLRRLGVGVDVMTLPVPWDEFAGLQKALCYWEAARLLLQGAVPVAPALRVLLEPYLDRDVGFYADALRRRAEWQGRFDALIAGYDAVLLPAATGAAPLWDDTGDAVMNRFWTALGVPVMTVPLWRDEAGLPLGLQMVGRLGGDERLAEAAEWMTTAGV